MSSVPRAVGVRAPYAAVPERVRAWVDRTLGSPVVTTADQVGGMSPGCATRVVCADGTRAFVKAVGAELNPVTPTLFRREVHALTLLGTHPLWADLLASYDDGAWVALLLEDVDGTHPDLDDDETMTQLVDATDELGRVLAARLPEPPVPDPDAGGLNDLRQIFTTWAGAFERAAELPAELLPDWVRRDAAGWSRRVAALADPTRAPGAVVHFDIRDDNLVRRPSGELVFVDWGQCGVGAAWLDPLVARLHRVDSPWFDASLATSPELVRAGDDVVTAWLVGFGTFLAWRSRTAVDVNLPTLGDFRRRESRRCLAAAARQLDLGARSGRC